MVRLASLLVTSTLLFATSVAAAQSPSVTTVRSISTGSRTLGSSSSIQLTGGQIPPEILAQLNARGGVTISSPSTDAGDGEAEETPVDPQRLQLFQQAMLDRRPSTILAEWAKPDPLASAEDPELQDPEDPQSPGDEPKAPEAPTAPVRPEDLVEPPAPEDLVAEVDTLADVVALAKAKELGFGEEDVFGPELELWEELK